jgi:hypothetical protein
MYAIASNCSITQVRESSSDMNPGISSLLLLLSVAGRADRLLEGLEKSGGLGT